MRHFFFNGIDSRLHGYVTKIKRTILPSIDPVFIKVPRRRGFYAAKNSSREIGANLWTISFGLLANNNEDLRARARAFAEWIYNANLDGTTKKFYTSDEPARIYEVF